MADSSPIPKLQSKELNSDGRPINLPGIYIHKDTGAKFITSEGDEGVAQADSLMTPLWEHAWERKGEVPSRLELLEMRKAQELKDAKAEAAEKKAKEDELAGIKAGGEVYEPKKSPATIIAK